MSLGNVVQLKTDFDTAIQEVTEALKTEGFGVLTEIDVKATFKKKLDKDFRPYTILGACNPHLAYEAFGVTSDVGMLVPCNVTVSEVEAGTIEISFVDPEAMLGVIDDLKVAEIACEARDKLKRVHQILVDKA